MSETLLEVVKPYDKVSDNNLGEEPLYQEVAREERQAVFTDKDTVTDLFVESVVTDPEKEVRVTVRQELKFDAEKA